MMYDAVSEIGSEYLTLYGLGNDKSDGTVRGVGASVYLITQRKEVRLVVYLKGDSIVSTSLVAATLSICLE